MIKVLHIITDSNFGGAGRVLLSMLSEYSRDRFEAFAALPRSSLLIPELKKLNVPYFEIDGIGEKSFSLSAVRSFRSLFKSEKPDIVHTHASLSARIAAKSLKVKVVHTRHSVFPVSRLKKSFPLRQISGAVNNFFSDKIIAVSPAAKENLIELGTNADRIRVIMNGVKPAKQLSDTEKAKYRKEFGLSESDFICAIMARLEDVKGHRYVLEAAKMLLTERPSIKILIAGTGSQENEIKEVIERDKLSNCIILGFVENIERLENIMDLQLNASFGTEATSMSLLEGMSLGKPAVVSDFGGNPYVIENGINGIVFASKNSAELAAAIKKLCSDKELYDEMSLHSTRIFSSGFTLNQMMRSTEQLYLELTKGETNV